MESKNSSTKTNNFKLKPFYCFITLAVFVIISTYIVLRTDVRVDTSLGIQPANHETLYPVPIQRLDKNTGKEDKPHFVLGILTPHMNKEQRDAQRTSWISSIISIKNDLPFKVTCKFLIDQSTDETMKEDNIYKDIVYLNVTHHGRAVKFGEKMYVWFKYIYNHYPDALLGGKMDDDAFLCIPHLLDRLDSIKSGKLYYGWGNEPGRKISIATRIDEMFLVLGRNLIERIANRTYCGKRRCRSKDELIDADYGGMSIGHWLSIYDDIEFHPDNERILQRGRGTEHAQFVTKDFCQNKLIFHKALPKEMKTLNEFNTLRVATRSGIQQVNHETLYPVPIQRLDKNTGKEDKPHFVLGILTPHMNKEQRDAQRTSWISSILSMKTDLPFKITYKFLIDQSSDETMKEDNIYKDILYLNVTHHGRAVQFGEKMYVWFKYIYNHYPDALLGGKMDDDAFLCIPHLLDRLDSIKSGKLYYGWGNGPGRKISIATRIDEMFLVLGRNLIERIANRTYCGKRRCRSKDELIDADYGGMSIGHWLSIYDDIEFHPDNERILQRGRGTEQAQFVTKDFCQNKLIFQKALPKEMKTLNEFNTLLDVAFGMAPFAGAVSGNMFFGEVTRQLPLDVRVKTEKPSMAIKDDTMNCDNWAVVTTIFKPSKAILQIANADEWCLLIVADTATPTKDFYLHNIKNTMVKYLSIEEQITLYPLLANLIPQNHFGRKNIGYMYAIQNDAKVIWDFDDDNIGIANLKDFSSHHIPSPYVTVCRGFPLQLIKDVTTIPNICDLQTNITLGIVQSLANMQPDVDAIYRLTRKVPFDFKANRNTHKPLVLPIDVYAPFNAQATLWFSMAFDVMPLPISVNGRVSDIWRSYIAQHLLFKRNIRLAFSSPYVTQDRNAHTIIKDFNAELDLFSKSKQLIDLLSASFYNDIVDIYRDLYKREYLEAADLQFIDAWQKTLIHVRNQRNESYTKLYK